MLHSGEVRTGRRDGELAQASSRQGDLLRQGSIARVGDCQDRRLRAETAKRLGFETDLDRAAHRVVAPETSRVGQAAGSCFRVGCPELELSDIVQDEVKVSGLDPTGPGGHRDRLVGRLGGEHNATECNRGRPGGDRRLCGTNAGQGRGGSLSPSRHRKGGTPGPDCLRDEAVANCA